MSAPLSFLQPIETGNNGTARDAEWQTEYSWRGGQLIAAYPVSDCPVIAGAGTRLPCGFTGATPTSIESPTFTIALDCPNGPCADAASLFEPSLSLVVAETQAPTLTAAPSTIGANTNWIRGTWPVSLSGTAPSGLCSISAQINSTEVATPEVQTPNDTTWQQCSLTKLGATVDTTNLPNGADTFTASAISAAGNTATINTPVKIDNTIPKVTLSGPTDVPDGSGAAQVTATATGGPSGISQIDCVVDGVSQTFPENDQSPAVATIPLTGVGQHTVSCIAEGGAVDGSNAAASSVIASDRTSIRTPAAALASFDRVVDKRVCRSVVKKVTIPAGFHEIKWHGHKVKAKLPAHTAKRKVRVCREKLATRKITVYKTVRRHGRATRVRRRETVKVPLAPHEVTKSVRTVAFGHTTTMSGTVLTTTGGALAGQTVVILGAPRNGRGNFMPIANTTTNVDGNWTATVPAGPGRVLEAVYRGNATTEPATSEQVRTIVHAKVKLAPITPARVAWGGKIALRGTLPGGHVPHKGINVRLVYGIGKHSITYAVRQHVGAAHHNRFTAHFIFGRGPASDRERFFFKICTLPSPRYPYAVGCSKEHAVEVGGHPRRRASR